MPWICLFIFIVLDTWCSLATRKQVLQVWKQFFIVCLITSALSFIFLFLELLLSILLTFLYLFSFLSFQEWFPKHYFANPFIDILISTITFFKNKKSFLASKGSICIDSYPLWMQYIFFEMIITISFVIYSSASCLSVFYVFSIALFGLSFFMWEAF